MTPVPTVAMDCGPLESRLDRLAASKRPAHVPFGICRRQVEEYSKAGFVAEHSDPMVRLSERI
jgi:hypothetical protein